MNKSKIFLYVFVGISVVAIASLLLKQESAFSLVKPLIMLSLIGYYVSSAAVRQGIFIRAMFFCWAGDVLLIFQPRDELFFLMGLVAFLIGHLLYIVSYRKFQWSPKEEPLLRLQKIRWSFPVILAGTGLIVVLFPKLGPMKAPVIIYALVLIGMVITALFRLGRTGSQSFWWLLTGAITFMISDSLLAVNKFYSPFEASGVLVMTTYILGQYWIVKGALLHENAPGKARV